MCWTPCCSLVPEPPPEPRALAARWRARRTDQMLGVPGSIAQAVRAPLAAARSPDRSPGPGPLGSPARCA
eukprot:7697076-Heterocapsa_arctica.AAC.1